VAGSVTEDSNNKSIKAMPVWRDLSAQIIQSPEELKVHVQRILFCLDNDLSDYSAGALQDLFLVLQEKGIDLRSRMFNLSSPILDYTERTYFQECLKDSNGLLSNDGYEGSVLHPKLTHD
jgi:hypothetical protein